MIRTTALALALVTAGVVPGRAQSRDFSFRRELSSGAHFALRNIIGDVRIEPASGRTLEVTAVKRAGRHGDPDDVEIRAVEMGDGVAICVYYPNSGYRSDHDRDDGDRARDDRDDDDRAGDARNDDRSSRRSTRSRRSDPCRREGNWGGNNRNDTEVSFTVRLPAGLDVDVRTVSGDVTGRGLRGRLDLGTVSGDLRLTDVQGASLDASSVSGDVELIDVDARDVGAETVSGNVTYTGRIQREGSYDFKTLSGDVELTLPEQPNARLRGSTFSGRLVSDLPTSRDGRRHRSRFEASWGDGSATIDVESFSGDVRIQTQRGR
jgi:Toastrack DUF4097